MKKALTVALLLVLLCSHTIISIAETLMPKESLSVGGLFTFSVDGYSFKDFYGYYKTNKGDKPFNFDTTDKSATHENLMIDIKVLNESTSELYPARLIHAYVNYDTKYDFEAEIYQLDLNHKNYITLEEFALGVLEEGIIRIICKVPNAVVESSKPIVLYLTVDSTLYKVTLR